MNFCRLKNLIVILAALSATPSFAADEIFKETFACLKEAQNQVQAAVCGAKVAHLKGPEADLVRCHLKFSEQGFVFPKDKFEIAFDSLGTKQPGVNSLVGMLTTLSFDSLSSVDTAAEVCLASGSPFATMQIQLVKLATSLTTLSGIKVATAPHLQAQVPNLSDEMVGEIAVSIAGSYCSTVTDPVLCPIFEGPIQSGTTIGEVGALLKQRLSDTSL